VAFTETDRTWIRKYVGYAAIFLQAEPRLENAITACQSVADGGSRPDASTENYIKGILYGVAAVAGLQGVTPGPASTTLATYATPARVGLLQIEQFIDQQNVFLGASSADGKEVEIDPVREVWRLRREGKRRCNELARMLGMRGVRADIFAVAPVIKDADPFGWAVRDQPFHTEDWQHWRRW
jgi:hypothetical protein